MKSFLLSLLFISGLCYAQKDAQALQTVEKYMGFANAHTVDSCKSLMADSLRFFAMQRASKAQAAKSAAEYWRRYPLDAYICNMEAVTMVDVSDGYRIQVPVSYTKDGVEKIAGTLVFTVNPQGKICSLYMVKKKG